MPTNVTADYKKAEQAFREARSNRERLDCLREMLRTIPKHKGTEHLQAEIKTRIKQLNEELAAPKKGGRKGPSYTVRPEGAAQIAMLGPPNAGKSSLHTKLTGSHTDVGPYPYTTKLPVPGMIPCHDINLQLVDLPPVSRDFMEPWIVNTLQPADAALLVVDLNEPECVDHVAAVRERLAERQIVLEEHWPWLEGGIVASAPAEEDEILDDPFLIRLPTVLVASKCDLDPHPGELDALEELLGVDYPAIATSVKTGQGLEELIELLFKGLGIVRVYSKIPGKSADTERPFTVRRGDTVIDVAKLVHKDIAATLRFARVWGESGQFEGQQVGPDHPVADGDIVELHSSAT
ncbi:MAG: TGS domain-containing protein [Arenicellales bacterium]|nr:TGS domain-containing protein [Arenicellales bacterium]